MSKDSKNKMIEINKAQADFYSRKTDTSRNFIYTLWHNLRKNGFWKYRQFLGIDAHVVDVHKKWLGNITEKTVLDLGCGAGNLLSPYLAKNARKYIAIDLSKPLLQKLDARLRKESIANYEIVEGDFLNIEFSVKSFDIIYAFGVMHHFKDFNELLVALNSKLSDDGVVVTYDPVNISIISRTLRALYRPFQPDADWEFPFEKKTFQAIERAFKIKEVQGYFGKSKNSFPLYFMFGNREWVRNQSIKNHKWDLENLNKVSPAIYSSLNVSMLLIKK
jgi:SAM-dependent methyltransferase